jgi:hypothetical protein
LLAVPLELVTDTAPEVPAPTTALILVELSTTKDFAAVPPNETALTAEKLVPVKTTVSSDAAKAGKKPVIVGEVLVVGAGSLSSFLHEKKIKPKTEKNKNIFDANCILLIIKIMNDNFLKDESRIVKCVKYKVE